MADTETENERVEDIGVEIIAAMRHEFYDATDRIIAVVGAAFLDDLLDRLLRAVFLDEPKELDKLLRPDAALGSNGSRYQLAYCLGLIRRDQRDDLRTIAKIRNQFAHRFMPRSA